jgi:predicted DNA-binding transcriptional regulator YafY
VYRGTDLAVQPLGLILKGYTWYLLGRARRSGERLFRLFRLSRIDAVELLDHRFDRPPGFDLPAAWAERRQSFLDSIPEYFVTLRVAPAAEPLLALLDEGTRPELPLPADVARDEHGWARLRLRFERLDSAARHLLRLGADVEVLDPPELRERMADAAVRLAALYGNHA